MFVSVYFLPRVSRSTRFMHFCPARITNVRKKWRLVRQMLTNIWQGLPNLIKLNFCNVISAHVCFANVRQIWQMFIMMSLINLTSIALQHVNVWCLAQKVSFAHFPRHNQEIFFCRRVWSAGSICSSWSVVVVVGVVFDRGTARQCSACCRTRTGDIAFAAGSDRRNFWAHVSSICNSRCFCTPTLIFLRAKVWTYCQSIITLLSSKNTNRPLATVFKNLQTAEHAFIFSMLPFSIVFSFDRWCSRMRFVLLLQSSLIKNLSV